MHTMINYVLIATWIAIAALYLGGGKTEYVLPFTLIPLALREEAFLNALTKKLTVKTVLLFGIAFYIASIAALILDYECLNGTLWDLTMYLQVVKNFSITGQPFYAFNGTGPSNYYSLHNSSVSLYCLKWLYSILPHPWLTLAWQGVFLFSSAAIAALWMKTLLEKYAVVIPKQQHAFYYLVAFLSGCFNIAFSSQGTWPYMPHVAGVFFLALAYLFYEQKKFTLWLFALILLTLEKQDFGGIASTFGLLVFIEALWKKIQGQPINIKPLVTSLTIVIFGVGYYFFYARVLGIGVPFQARFGELANSPQELIKLFILNPHKILQALLRPASIKYAGTFFIGSFVWLRPKAFKYFIPVFPHLILNCLGDARFQSLKDHYSLPLGVGLQATLILGVFQAALKDKPPGRFSLRGFLFTLVFVQTIWCGQSVFRTFREKAARFSEVNQERKIFKSILAEVANSKTVICCEDRLCSYLAEHPHAFQLEACLKPAPALAGLAGQKVIFATYAGTDLGAYQGLVSRKNQTSFVEIHESDGFIHLKE